MKLLITGASGFIGRTCLRVFRGHDVLGTFRSNPVAGLEMVDLVNASEVDELVGRFRPDAIVHCAARPSVDWCEEHPTQARHLNVDASLNLLRAAERVGARMAFVSTDYVFDGTSGPYSEDAVVNPINVYGRLKLEVEDALRVSSAGHLIVRTTNVYGYDHRSKNFLMALLPRLAAGEKVGVASDQFGTPVHVEDLCATMLRLVEGRVEGVVHVVGPDLVNRVEWLRVAAQTFGLNQSLVGSHETDQLAQPARRPLWAGLRAGRLSRLGVAPPRRLREGLAYMRTEKLAAAEQAW